MKTSIIIVSRNRASDLRQTLDSLERIQVPDGMETELLVIDNGSSDETALVTQTAARSNPAIRYSFQPVTGKTNGQNLGVSTSTGDIILFTDDDVRPPENWLFGMCDPILSGKADVVCGGVRIAKHLLRPWMTPMHRSWLASSEWLTSGNPQSLIGANMGFARSVLKRVPAFDTELGPGAAGFSDDHLFARQLIAAGYQIQDQTHLSVEHHFDPIRLTRESWLDAAAKHGASRAYVGHHWEHWDSRLTKPRLYVSLSKLAIWRSTHPDRLASEGCCVDELNLVFQCAMLRRHLQERHRKRNYARHGLVKLH